MNSRKQKEAVPCVTSTQDSREREKYGYYRSRPLLYHIIVASDALKECEGQTQLDPPCALKEV